MVGGLDGYHAFKLYFGIRQHFEGKYDVFAQRGRIRYSRESFEKRNDKRFFHKLGSSYLKGDLANYFMANILAGKTHVSEMTDRNFRIWKMRMQSIDRIFTEDLDLVFNTKIDFNDTFKSITGDLPIILQLLNGNHITLETICALNTISENSILEKWDCKITDKFLWPQIRQRIVKYTPFMKNVDVSELTDILKQKLGLI